MHLKTKMMKYLFLFLLLPISSFAQKEPYKIYFKSGEIVTTQYATVNNGVDYAIPFVRIDNRLGTRIAMDRINYIEGKDVNGRYQCFQPIQFRGRDIWGERI